MGVQFTFGSTENVSQHVVCIGFSRLTSGTDTATAAKLDEKFKLVTGFEYGKVSCCTIADKAAAGVAKVFHHDEAVCSMHVDDKIARSAIGDLVCTKNKVKINPFPEGQRVINLAHDAASYFNKSTRCVDLHKLSDMISGGLVLVFG